MEESNQSEYVVRIGVGEHSAGVSVERCFCKEKDTENIDFFVSNTTTFQTFQEFEGSAIFEQITHEDNIPQKQGQQYTIYNFDD